MQGTPSRRSQEFLSLSVFSLSEPVIGGAAKQEEEQARALVKEDLAVAMHRDASQPKSLQSSTHKIFQKHFGGQQLLQGIVQTKAVAKAKEAKGQERPRVTSRAFQNGLAFWPYSWPS